MPDTRAPACERLAVPLHDYTYEKGRPVTSVTFVDVTGISEDMADVASHRQS
jgi:hypothetical protein